jgi:hypothetical protein
MSSDSATKLATQQSIKAYVDSQVGTVDTLAEILANGNTSGANNLIIDSGQALTANTINETTAGSGVTIDSVLLKDDVVNATDIETSNISANDGTAAATIANSTGVMTIASSVLTTTDINGGSIDGTNIGASSAGTGAFTTLSATGNLTVDTNTLFVDSTSNQVAIGTTSPESRLSIVSGAGLDGQALDVWYGSGNNQPLNIGINRSSGNSWLGWNALQSTTDTQTYHVTNGAARLDGASGTLTVLGAASGTAGNPITWITAADIGYTGSVFNEGGNDIDFRVESSGNANMLHVDGGNNGVGIGTTGTTTPLTVNGGTASVATIQLGNHGDNASIHAKYSLSIKADSTESIADRTIGFGIGAGTSLGLTTSASIFNDFGADLDFRVESSGNANALFVDAGNSRVGINTNAPSTPLEIRAALSTVYTGTSASAEHVNIFNTDTGAVGLTSGIRFQTRALDVSGQGFFIGATATSGGSAPNFKFQKQTGATTYEEIAALNVSEAVFNDPGNNYDFRVESDSNTHMLFVDAGSDRVSIGDSVSNGLLTVVGGGTGSYNQLTLSNTTDANSDKVAGLTTLNYAGNNVSVFQSFNQSGANSLYFGSADNTHRGYTSINSYVASSDTATTGHRRIHKATYSEFCVNEDSEDVDFRVESDTDAHAIFLDAGNNALSLLGGNAPASNSVCIEKDLIVARASNTPNFMHDFAGGGYKLSRSGVGSKFFARSGGATGAADVSRLYINDEGGWTTVDITGDVDISGALSKGSGSFKIDHPLKPDTHHLVHSFLEAPQADNVYRGKVDLVAGTASVNIDTVAGMTDGTFVLLNREVQCFTSNESGWTAVRGSVSGNTLTITAQDNTCVDTISWLVIGERQDQHMYDTNWTDENGKVIVEPEKTFDVSQEN